MNDGICLRSTKHPRPVWYMRPVSAFKAWRAARRIGENTDSIEIETADA